jgi:hypothetical protein
MLSSRQTRWIQVLGIEIVTLVMCTGAAQAGTLPSSPEGTVRAVMQSLADNQPQILWEALPPSYRSDITSLTREFATKMDPELYNKVFQVLQKAVDVLQTKKDFMLESSLMEKTGADREQAVASYDAVVGLLKTVINSEISSLEKLKSMDYQRFLSGTCAGIMEQAAAVSKASPDNPYENKFKAKMTGVGVEVLSSEGDTATIRITAPDEEPEEMTLVRVEERWVPKDMAEGWQGKIEHARSELATLDMSSETMVERKVQGMMMLGMAEGFIDQLAAAQSAEEFDTMLQGLFGGFLGGAAEDLEATDELDEGDVEEDVEEDIE